MKRPLLALLLLSSGFIGIFRLHDSTQQARSVNTQRYQQLREITKQTAHLTTTAAIARQQVADKKMKALQTADLCTFSPELLQLLTGSRSNYSLGKDLIAWQELRDQLETDWNRSGSFVLVSTAVVSRLNFSHFNATDRPSDTANLVFALTPPEQLAISDALNQARQSAMLRVQRSQPEGDEVAKYTIQADPVVEASISNHFSAQITGILGAERSDLFLAPAWRELKSDLSPNGTEPVTMTIRHTVLNSQSKLIWELVQGTAVYTGDLRYGNYPSSWFLTLFPGGWAPIATREGFELPESFRN
jgi:hypothetical protein